MDQRKMFSGQTLTLKWEQLKVADLLKAVGSFFGMSLLTYLTVFACHWLVNSAILNNLRTTDQ